MVPFSLGKCKAEGGRMYIDDALHERKNKSVLANFVKAEDLFKSLGQNSNLCQKAKHPTMKALESIVMCRACPKRLGSTRKKIYN